MITPTESIQGRLISRKKANLMHSPCEKSFANKTDDSLPKILPGKIQRRFVRCGKSNCRCQRGELHGPYFYRYWWENGRTLKQYVAAESIQTVTAACKRMQREKRRARVDRDLVREMTMTLRSIEGAINDQCSRQEFTVRI